MAKEPLFSKLFRESPFSLLKKHMEVVNQTVVTLSDFFAAALVATGRQPRRTATTLVILNMRRTITNANFV